MTCLGCLYTVLWVNTLASDTGLYCMSAAWRIEQGLLNTMSQYSCTYPSNIRITDTLSSLNLGPVKKIVQQTCTDFPGHRDIVH